MQTFRLETGAGFLQYLEIGRNNGSTPSLNIKLMALDGVGAEIIMSAALTICHHKGSNDEKVVQ